MEDARLGGSVEEKLDRIAEMLRSIADEEPAVRRRLTHLRNSAEYEEAFKAKKPLVSIVIATYSSFDTLRDVALPSALAQTYRNIEVVVVGDGAPPETAAVVEACGDRRVRYEHLALRGPSRRSAAGLVHGGDARVQRRDRRCAGALDQPAGGRRRIRAGPRRAAARRRAGAAARVRLLAPARASGRRERAADRRVPARHGHFGLQAALYHAGLSFMELNFSDAVFGVPNDWSLCRRMMRAGVRMGMVDAATVDYYPSEEWGRRSGWLATRFPPSRHDAARAQAAEEELARVRARADELERELAVVTSSKSWRLTSPLRAAAKRARERSSG